MSYGRMRIDFWALRIIWFSKNSDNKTCSRGKKTIWSENKLQVAFEIFSALSGSENYDRFARFRATKCVFPRQSCLWSCFVNEDSQVFATSVIIRTSASLIAPIIKLESPVFVNWTRNTCALVKNWIDGKLKLITVIK